MGEGGGAPVALQDHVPPPPAPSPDGINSTSPPFDFTRLGVRVPAVFASPYIAAGTVLHGPTGPNATAYEHSSIARTIRGWFAPGAGNLTARDAWAAPFDAILNIPHGAPRHDCPLTLPEAASHRLIGGLGPADGSCVARARATVCRRVTLARGRTRAQAAPERSAAGDGRSSGARR